MKQRKFTIEEKQKLVSINKSLKICPDCQELTCFLLPKFEWENEDLKADENGIIQYIKKVCPSCLRNK